MTSVLSHATVCGFVIWVLLKLPVGDSVWIALYLLLRVAMNPFLYVQYVFVHQMYNRKSHR